MNKRGRPEEKCVPMDLIEQLHQLHEDWIFGQKHVPPVKVFDVSANVNEITLKDILCL